MRIIRITGIYSLLCFSLFSCINTAKDQAEKEFHLKVPDYHFEMVFPVAEEQVKKTVTIQSGVEVFDYKADMRGMVDQNMTYQLDYNRDPAGKITLGDSLLRKIYDEQRIRIIDEVNSRLQSEVDPGMTCTFDYEKEFKLNGIPGRYFCATMSGGGIKPIKIHHKLIYVKGIFYKLTLMTTDLNFPNESANKFFDSFKILGK